jgi:hypothetical protein
MFGTQLIRKEAPKNPLDMMMQNGSCSMFLFDKSKFLFFIFYFIYIKMVFVDHFYFKVMLRFKITLNEKLTNELALRPECNWRLQA